MNTLIEYAKRHPLKPASLEEDPVRQNMVECDLKEKKRKSKENKTKK